MRGRITSLLLLCAFLAACNYPLKVIESDGISGAELRKTLAAQSQITGIVPSVPPDLVGTPLLSTQTTSVTNHPPTLIAPIATLQEDPTIFEYYAQSGDTPDALALRFDVFPPEILSNQILSEKEFISVGEMLFIPRRLDETSDPTFFLPDSEIINSPSAVYFDLDQFVAQSGGYLSQYSENVGNRKLTGIEIVRRVASDASVNPRILLALLEFRSGWVLGEPLETTSIDYPLGFVVPGQKGLYKELVMTATHLNAGYYGWRSGMVTKLSFRDGSQLRIHPGLNAGTVGIQVLFSKWYRQNTWKSALYGNDNFLSHHVVMFGDPWLRAAQVEPLFSSGLTQPELVLPFAPGERWSLTGGPHETWNSGSPRGAIDLAPVTGEVQCAVSYSWVLASAPGLITRSERNIVVVDLDGDGYEQTGWNLFYFHIADQDRIHAGSTVQVDDRIGHPSCEGGRSTGTHVHIARKYNGEWLSADGPLPFVLSGWQVYAGEKNYQGELRKDGQIVYASPVGPRTSIVVR